jgi:TetR/AcrR family transcriptional repressor of nem operon
MPKPKQYDEAEMLTLAMEAFWAQGYTATSVEHLVEATGLNRSSLYHAYDGKAGLFRAALTHYNRNIVDDLLVEMERGPAGVATIKRVFDRFVASQSAMENRWGCLMTNTATELAPHDAEINKIVRRYLDRFESAIHAALQRGQDSGEVAKGANLRELARSLTAMSQGLLVMAKASASPATMRSVARSALSSIPSA